MNNVKALNPMHLMEQQADCGSTDESSVVDMHTQQSAPHSPPTSFSVGPERLRKALIYLAETDEPFAKAKALVEGLSEQRKTIKAVAYLQSTGSQGDRTEMAYACAAYKQHIDKLNDAIYDFEIMRNKRSTESLIVEVWRSFNAARRSGNLY